MLRNKDAKAKAFQGRIYVCLYDEDGDDTYPHGVMLAPPTVRTKARAVSDLNNTLAAVKKAKRDEWNYDDLIDAMQKIGWQHINPVIWVENRQEDDE